MQKESTSQETEQHGHGHEHHEPGFWQQYIFSTDHKVIGVQYLLTSLLFLFFGFLLMAAMRWQLAYPGEPMPFIGGLLQWLLGPEMIGNKILPDGTEIPGVMMPDLYNSFGAMHGTIMVFLAIVPAAFAAFGNFVMPLQIGAPDMTFPRINMASYHVYFWGGVSHVV